MKFIDDFSTKLGKVIRVTIDSYSLQFRLIVGIIFIVTVGWSSFTVRTIWEIKQFLLSADQQQNLSYDDTLLLEFIQNLRTASIVWFAFTIALVGLFLWRSLLPLRQFERWVLNSAAGLNSFPPKVKRAPREIEILAENWQGVLAKLSEVKQQQRQALDNLAHELRTPLSMVYGYLQRTQQHSHNLTARQQEALAMAVAEAQRMKQLLQNLLDLVRADSKTMPLQIEPLELNDLVKEVAQMMEKFEHRVIEVKVAPLPLQVKADRARAAPALRDRLMQVLSHLLNNALKYSHNGEPVTIELSHCNNWAVIEVSDRGCGILPSQQSRIFEPFYRVEQSRARSTGGAGLGLSLAKRLVEDMGGAIAVRSKPGQGSTFTVRLPLLGANP
jgi:signal transduction histidine kinase